MQASQNMKNDEKLEQQWAESAHKYASLYERLIVQTVPEKHKTFHFTPNDDKLYQRFQQVFPNIQVQPLNIEYLNQKQMKAEMYSFLELNQDLVKDYNMGTLLRVDAHKSIGPQNCIVVPRLEFYMIEIARFRQGVNLEFRKQNLENNQVEVKQIEIGELASIDGKAMNSELYKLQQQIKNKIDSENFE